MSTLALTRILKALGVLVFVAAATPTRDAASSSCPGDPAFFCNCARAAAQQCWWEYEACGGLFVEGCWETYSQCIFESGIDQCQ